MSDFWADSLEVDVPEPPKPVYEGLPDGVTIIARTTDATDKDTVRPSIKEITSPKGTFYRFKCPTVVIGGEAKVDAKFVGRYLFLDLSIEKPTVEQLEKGIATATANGNEATANRLRGQLSALDKYPCAPELYNLILDTLAPTEDKAPERWAAAKAILASKAKELGYDPSKFNGNTQYTYAETFKQVLLAKQYTIIGKTYTPKAREGSTYTPGQTLGSVGADGDEQRKKRKVALIEAKKEDVF
jgi:hypothetical protein